MKKLLSIVTAFTILMSFMTVPVGFANTTIVIPAESESSLTDIQLESIKDFLEDFEIVSTCLRNTPGQENANLTLGVGICSLLQVFDPKGSGGARSWSIAKRLGLVKATSKQASTMKGVEFLSVLFEVAGVTVSPFSESIYKEMFSRLRLRLNKNELHVISIALENGLVPPPQNENDAQLLKVKLTRRPIKVSEALGFLFQIATSEHSGAPVITITNIGGNEKPVLLENILEEVVQTIKTQSYYSDNFDEKAAMEAAIKALVESLKEDKYIEYYTQDEYKSFSSGLNGDVEGIGAYIEEKDGKIIIIAPIEGGPADKAGIHAGDIILKIDNVSVEGLSLQEAINKIRGPQGTKVKLQISRDQQMLEITITREKLSIPSVISSSKDGFEIIKIVQFGSTVSSELLTVLKTLPTKNPKGIIIDLRNDPGGFLNEVVTIVNFFLAKDKPVVFLNDRHQQTPINTTVDPIISGIPISVLINKGSASASEILAGALQAYGLAKIYGETSYGKGTVQNIITLHDPHLNQLSAFKFTTSEYLIGNPYGAPISINGIGVKPNDNPGGANQPLLDDEKTTNDEALDAVIGIMSGSGVHR